MYTSWSLWLSFCISAICNPRVWDLLINTCPNVPLKGPTWTVPSCSFKASFNPLRTPSGISRQNPKIFNLPIAFFSKLILPPISRSFARALYTDMTNSFAGMTRLLIRRHVTLAHSLAWHAHSFAGMTRLPIRRYDTLAHSPVQLAHSPAWQAR